MARTYDEKINATNVRAYYRDFDGELSKWKDSFYTLWRYQLTWDFAYRIDLKETKNGVYVDMLIRNSYKKNVLETMEDLGYRSVYEDDVFIGEVWAYEHDELEGIEALVLDY